MLENTEGAIKMNKPEKLATQDTQETGQINVREYRRGNGKKGNPEKLAIQGTQDTGQISVRENRSGNQEWTIKRHWQHWTHKTHDK